MKETWKDIPGYENHYQVSDMGNVRSLNFLGHKGVIHLLKQTKSYDGYLRVPLTLNGTKRTLSTHILVAKAFIPNPEKKPQVNHIDGNKENNCVHNLEWVTGKENIQHAIRNGLRKAELPYYRTGANHPCSKPIYQYSLSGTLVKKWDCVSDAARSLDCKPVSLINCSKGRIKSCKGYMWKMFEGDAPSSIKPLSTKNYPRLILQMDLQGHLIKEWNGYSQLREETSYRLSDICACCKGDQKTAFGYRWEERPLPFS